MTETNRLHPLEAPAGPVLVSGTIADAIIAAIRSLDQTVRIEDRGAYQRVLVRGKCVVTRAAIEQQLGRAFSFPSDLEMVMPSFVGKLVISSSMASWTGTFKDDADAAI